MRSLPVLVAGVFAAGAALAEEVGAPAGCAVAATLVKPDCEMHQVLACEGSDATRVDVYGEGVFLREMTFEAIAMTRWRHGVLVQTLEPVSGTFRHVPSMPADGLVEVVVTRVRKQLGTDGGPPPEDFDYTIRVDGPAVRDLPGGGDREVRRFHVLTSGAGQEGSDMRIDYDPALGLPIWRTGTVTAPDGSQSQVNLGAAHVLMPGDPGYMEDRAPDGAACTPG